MHKLAVSREVCLLINCLLQTQMEEERSASRLSLERAEKAEGVLAQKQDGFNSVLAHANAQVEAANDRVQVSLYPHVIHNCSHLFGHPPLPLGPPRGPRLLTPASPSSQTHAPVCLHHHALSGCLSSLKITGLLPAPCVSAPADCTIHHKSYLPSCCTRHAEIGFCSLVCCVLQGSNQNA